jgi:hypothetical protein
MRWMKKLEFQNTILKKHVKNLKTLDKQRTLKTVTENRAEVSGIES